MTLLFLVAVGWVAVIATAGAAGGGGGVCQGHCLGMIVVVVVKRIV